MSAEGLDNLFRMLDGSVGRSGHFFKNLVVSAEGLDTFCKMLGGSTEGLDTLFRRPNGSDRPFVYLG